MKSALAETMDLPVSERIRFVTEIWDSIADNPDAIEISEETLELLRKRLSEHKSSTDTGSSWKEVKERILNR